MTIKLISSNIRFSNSGDGVHHWEARRPLLVEIYKNFRPDILGTQEGRIGQIKELDSDIPGLELIETHRNWIDERMYPCLFFNPEAVLVHTSGDIWLSQTPHVPGSSSFNSAFPRLCTWALVTFKKHNLQMLVINTHLDHVLSSTREKQVEVLINEIKKLGHFPLFIMGDFNESPLTALKKNLMNAFFLIDPWQELGLPEETSHHGFKGEETNRNDRIDWILSPRDFDCSEIYLDKRKGPSGIYPSDHYPILATFTPK